MGCRGIHFALTESERDQLLAVSDNDKAVLAIIQEEIEEKWDRDWLCQTDKAWDAIHRCLTDGTLVYGNNTPFHKVILGGALMYSGDDYIVSFVDCEDVWSVAEAIAPITKPQLRKRYDAIESSDYSVPLSDKDFEYTWANFTGLQQFFQKAADGERSVIFTVNQ